MIQKGGTKYDMRKKRLLSVTVILAMLVCLLALTGCSAETGSGDGKDGERVIYLRGYARAIEGEEANWEKVINAFEEENPGVTVDVQWTGSADESVQALSTAKMSGETIDLFLTGPANINATLANNGYLMDLTELMKPYMDRFDESMFSGLYIGDHLWGVPFGDMSFSMVIYNKTLFEEAGIAIPQTMDDMITAAEQLKAYDPEIVPMLHMGKMPMFWPMWFMETYAQSTENHSVDYIYDFLNGERTFTGEEEIEAFDLIKDFYDKGILTSESFDTDSESLVAAFAQGRTAMCFSMGFAYTSILNAVGDSIEVGAFAFPQVVDGVQPQHGGGTNDALVIPSFCNQDNLDITMKFVEYITRAENASAIFAARDLLAPTIKGMEASDVPIREALDNDILPNTIQFLDWIWPAEVNEAFKSAIPANLSGEMTSEQAAQSIQNALDTVRNEQNYDAQWWENWTDEQWASVTPGEIPPDYSE